MLATFFAKNKVASFCEWLAVTFYTVHRTSHPKRASPQALSLAVWVFAANGVQVPMGKFAAFTDHSKILP
jgi:hypothetical protein